MSVYGTNLDIDEDGHFIQSNRTNCGRYILRETEVIDTVGTKSIDLRNWFPIVPVPLYPKQSYHSTRTAIFIATLESVNKELIGHGFSIAASLNIDDAQNFEIQWKSGVI